ncbi:MAG: hypothetical protein A3A51_04260 [Candidatus Levybacteria bacterium RIFCSPLOWO2_01_FULL_39_10]|nr:MAG: hypothetical protein A3A51_04260 [Candidatus Levybacteria bacterium RIFCSPLOWO2_01_FULL_39_10]
MPVTKSAKKKLRKDRNRKKENLKFASEYKEALKKARKSPTAKNVSEAFKKIDKATKKNLIHKNKAGRLKSSLSKLTGSKKTAPSATKPKSKAK